MSKYHKRVITYDSDTQNYTVAVPELGIEVLSDTESRGLIDVREEIHNAVRENRIGPAPLTIHPAWFDIDPGIDPNLPRQNPNTLGTGGTAPQSPNYEDLKRSLGGTQGSGDYIYQGPTRTLTELQEKLNRAKFLDNSRWRG